MATFFSSLLVKIWSVLLALILLFIPNAQLPGEAAAPADKDVLKFNFTVLSDTHIESYTFWRFQDLRLALKDLKRAEVKSEALVHLGDNTMNGQGTEYTSFYALLSFFSPVKNANTLVAMGNHDINQSKTDIDKAVNRHNTFYNGYTGAKNDKPYYSREIGGYTFIILGSENAQMAGTSAYFSPEQIAWLDDTLAKASESGKPIFLFNHQPFDEIISDEDALAVVKQYENVIFFSGHRHTDFNVTTDGSVTLVNMPNFSRETVGGPGLAVEVYENKVLLRNRLFAKGEWVANGEYTIDF